jgi:hypothetical protein
MTGTMIEAMIAAKKKSLVSAAMCLALAGSALRAYPQSPAAAAQDANPAVEAVDASAHADADGQPQEPSPAEAPPARPLPGKATTQHPATVVWPLRAHPSATDTDDKNGPLPFGISSFRPAVQRGGSTARLGIASPASQGATEPGADQNHSDKDRSWKVNSAPAHPSSYGGTAVTLLPRTKLPPVSISDRAPEYSVPFGNIALGPAIPGPFPKSSFSGNREPVSVKRHAQQARKARDRSRAKNSIESPRSTPGSGARGTTPH